MTSQAESKLRIALVGAGTVGTAVSYLLSKQGHQVVAVASRSLDSALRASERLNAEVFRPEDLPSADLYLLGVSDSAIEETCRSIAPRFQAGSFVVHFAGSFGSSLLHNAMEAGASGCAVHPVQACPTVDTAIARLPGSVWGITCSDPGAQERMVQLVDRDLQGIPIVVSEKVRPVWHAAAAVTANGIAALLAIGEGLLAEIGVDEPSRVLGPLASGTVQNAREEGGGATTLTGPVVRGDLETLRRHLRALGDLPDVHRDRYKEVMSLIVHVGVATGRIPTQTGAQILREIVG